VLAAGVKTLQLRIKTPEQPDPQWTGLLRAEIRRSVAACKAEGAELFINDHWQVAAEEGAHGVHLGQEDLLALGDAGRAALQATGMALGISSHSLWELCRARTLAPRYIACGPVWPTLTKAMPWLPQGLDNLAWWCRMASAPVVAIGGILEADKVFEAARCGADGVCIVRGLGERPETVVPALQAALEAGRAAAVSNPCALAGPHPSLVNQAAPASA
jgi:hydroxymethylpyrimidine kinase/phosphomethylpyrimidine kinase/thiamine-phosphate diphosphorylase